MCVGVDFDEAAVYGGQDFPIVCDVPTPECQDMPSNASVDDCVKALFYDTYTDRSRYKATMAWGTANCNLYADFSRFFLLKMQKEWRIAPEE